MEEYQMGPGRVWKPETAGERAYLPEPLEPERLPAPAGRDGPAPVRPRTEAGGSELEAAVSPSAEMDPKKEGAETETAGSALTETGFQEEKAETEAVVSPSAEMESKEEEAVPANAGAEAKKPLSNEAVTGHTASLWKYLPVPAEEPEPAPETLRLRGDRRPGSGEEAQARGHQLRRLV